jgi:hypothetical protein
MARSPTGVQINMHFGRDEMERIDMVRGLLSRHAWIRLVVAHTLGAHPAFQSPHLRRLISDLPKLGPEIDQCWHPPERVHKGFCAGCGQFTIDPPRRKRPA